MRVLFLPDRRENGRNVVRRGQLSDISWNFLFQTRRGLVVCLVMSTNVFRSDWLLLLVDNTDSISNFLFETLRSRSRICTFERAVTL